MAAASRVVEEWHPGESKLTPYGPHAACRPPMDSSVVAVSTETRMKQRKLCMLLFLQFKHTAHTMGSLQLSIPVLVPYGSPTRPLFFNPLPLPLSQKPCDSLILSLPARDSVHISNSLLSAYQELWFPFQLMSPFLHISGHNSPSQSGTLYCPIHCLFMSFPFIIPIFLLSPSISFSGYQGGIQAKLKRNVNSCHQATIRTVVVLLTRCQEHYMCPVSSY